VHDGWIATALNVAGENMGNTVLYVLVYGQATAE
jgi:hypothetical protein